MPSGEAPKPAPKSKALWIVIAVVVVVVVVLLAAVFGGLFGPPEDRVLRIGTVLSLTGTSGLEVFGPSNLKGVQLAVNEINAAGGVLGRPIVLVSEDDGGSAATGRDRAQKLVTTNHVDAIIGGVGSGICQAILEGVTKPNGVVQMSASCTSSLFSNATYTGGWFFRTAPPDKYQGRVAAQYAYGNRSLRSVAVIGNDNPYGRGLANTFADKFRLLGGTAEVAIFAEGQASYASDLQALFSKFSPGLPEAVYLVEYPTDGLKVLKEWAANSAWSGIDWLFSEGLLDQAGFVDLLDEQGISLTTMQTFEGSAPASFLGFTGSLYTDFLTRFRAAYGATADPGLFTPNAYDAVYLIAAAAQKAGTATSQGIKDNLQSVAAPNSGGTDTVVKVGEWSKILTELAASRDINYEGASGSVNLDNLGDPLSAYAIWGINATQKVATHEFFSESDVLSIFNQGAPPLNYLAAVSVSSVDWIASPAGTKA